MLLADLLFPFYGRNIQVSPAPPASQSPESAPGSRANSVPVRLCGGTFHTASAGEDGVAAYRIKFMKRLKTRRSARRSPACGQSASVLLTALFGQYGRP